MTRDEWKSLFSRLRSEARARASLTTHNERAARDDNHEFYISVAHTKEGLIIYTSRDPRTVRNCYYAVIDAMGRVRREGFEKSTKEVYLKLMETLKLWRVAMNTKDNPERVPG